MVDKSLESAIDEISFCASPEQRVCKAGFWAKMGDDAVALNRETITLAQARAVTGVAKLARWWPVPGFREWFINGEEWKQKLLYVIDVGLDALIDIMADDNPKTAGARVKAFEVACRLAGREPAKTKEVRFIDKGINDMNEQQLQAFIESRGYGNKALEAVTELDKGPDKEEDETEVG
jgi:hypothetical protein